MLYVQYRSPPCYLSRDEHEYAVFDVNFSTHLSNHELRVYLCLGDAVITNIHFINLCDDNNLRLMVPGKNHLNYEATSLRIDICDRMTGGVLLSFFKTLQNLYHNTSIPFHGVANPLFPYVPTISMTISAKEISSLASPEHWVQDKQFVVLRCQVISEDSMAQWFPPAAGPHITEPHALQDTLWLNVCSFVLTKDAAQLHEHSTLLVSAQHNGVATCLGYVTGGRGTTFYAIVPDHILGLWQECTLSTNASADITVVLFAIDRSVSNAVRVHELGRGLLSGSEEAVEDTTVTLSCRPFSSSVKASDSSTTVIVGRVTLQRQQRVATPLRTKYSINDCCADIIRYHITDPKRFDLLEDEVCVSVVGQWLMHDTWAEALASYIQTGTSLSAIDGNGWTRVYAICLCLMRLVRNDVSDVRLGNVCPSVVASTLLCSLLKYACESYAVEDRDYVASCAYILLSFASCDIKLFSEFLCKTSPRNTVVLLAHASRMINNIVTLEEYLSELLCSSFQTLNGERDRMLVGAFCELDLRPVCKILQQIVIESIRSTSAANSTMVTVPVRSKAASANESFVSSVLLEQSKLLAVATTIEKLLLQIFQQGTRHAVLGECWGLLRTSLFMLFSSITGLKSMDVMIFLKWANTVQNSFTRASLLTTAFTAAECELCFGSSIIEFERLAYEIIQYLTQLHADNQLVEILHDGECCVRFLTLLQCSLDGCIRLCGDGEEDIRFACITTALPPIMRMILLTFVQSCKRNNCSIDVVEAVVKWLIRNLDSMAEMLLLQLSSQFCSDAVSLISVIFALIEMGCDVYDELMEIAEEMCSEPVRRALCQRIDDLSHRFQIFVVSGTIQLLPKSYLTESITSGGPTLEHVVNALSSKSESSISLHTNHVKDIIAAIHGEVSKGERHQRLLRLSRTVLHVLSSLRLFVGSMLLSQRDTGNDILSLSDSDEGMSNAEPAIDDTAMFNIYALGASLQSIYTWMDDWIKDGASDILLSRVTSLQKMLSVENDFVKGCGFALGCVALKASILNSVSGIKVADMQYQALHRQLCSVLLRSGLWEAGKAISMEHQQRHEQQLAKVREDQHLKARISALIVEEKRQKDVFHERLVNDSVLRIRPIFYTVRFVTPPWMSDSFHGDTEARDFLLAVCCVCPVYGGGSLGACIAQEELWLTLRFDSESFSAAKRSDDDIYVFGSYAYVLDKLLTIFHDYSCAPSDTLYDANSSTCCRKRVLQVFEAFPFDPFPEPETVQSLPPTEARRNTDELLDVLYRTAPGLGTEPSTQTVQSIPESMANLPDTCTSLSPVARMKQYHPRCLEFYSAMTLTPVDKVAEAIKPVRIQLNLFADSDKDHSVCLSDMSSWLLHCAPCGMVSSIFIEPVLNVIRCCSSGLHTLRSDLLCLASAVKETSLRIQAMNASATTQILKPDVSDRNTILHHAAAIMSNALSSSPTSSSSFTLNNSEILVIAEEQRREMYWHGVRKEAKKLYNTRKSAYDMKVQEGATNEAPPVLDLDNLETQFYTDVSGPSGKLDVADFLALRNEVLSLFNNTLTSYREACMSINQKPLSPSRAELRKMRSVSSEEYAKTKLSMPAYAPQIKQREQNEADERLEDADEERAKWLQVTMWLEAHYFAMDCGEPI